ncbi:SDR family NAD(P)-dependent oxidoreductase [Gordonia zhaorongruii]|uniref:SDR family NAD(P)-dependent oxidoreductase n=1 Tax=Gordonia zhaorongruii TaxID=2597659 RepID=UPI0014050E9C|nr:SDR family NAD(P)-dependent oxidoreductase [Gordonia zhaorongruii]
MNQPDLAAYGPWAVVVGGSEGVGAQFAEQLAAAGVDLVLIARKEGPLEDTAQRCRDLGREVRTVSADLTVPADLDRVMRATDPLDVGLLVCNAGANSYGSDFVDGDLAEFMKVLTLNVAVPMALAHHYGARMKKRGSGGVVTIGSLSGYLGSSQHTVYGGAKAFVRIFSEGLWLELRDAGVDVLHLVLGVTDTPAMRRAGLDFDLPGLVVGRPDEVAAEGLAHLAEGPVHVVSGNERGAAVGAKTDRARAVLGHHRLMSELMKRPADGGRASDVNRGSDDA